MTATAAMFPGQGLFPGEISRDELAAEVPDLVALCEQMLGVDPFALTEWPTSIAQPAILCASLARWRRGREQIAADYLIGHSLGEITALVAADALAPEDALALAVQRGRLTEETATGTDTGMLAVGAPIDVAEALAREVGATVANDNSPTQVVLSGRRADLRRAAAAARADGRRRFMLPVPAAFHSVWMEPAVEPFRAALRAVDFCSPSLPVISCITCEPITDPVEELALALTSRVRWRELLLQLDAEGVERFHDVGPGDVLEKLARQTLQREGHGAARG